MLANALDSRIDSDYDVLYQTEQALAEEVLEDARRFVDRAEQYLHQAGAL